ncbi:hypothetical protein EJ07DRAFT_152625 [Lizonia empirigonia]|nr:hypothetical protein EJ07DRAFT_152625 [Lizonia empirigonia]
MGKDRDDVSRVTKWLVPRSNDNAACLELIRQQNTGVTCKGHTPTVEHSYLGSGTSASCISIFHSRRLTLASLHDRLASKRGIVSHILVSQMSYKVLCNKDLTAHYNKVCSRRAIGTNDRLNGLKFRTRFGALASRNIFKSNDLQRDRWEPLSVGREGDSRFRSGPLTSRCQSLGKTHRGKDIGVNLNACTT